MKGQTAMEYLMTYGWAILIITVVIIALWSLGVFTLTEKEIECCEIIKEDVCCFNKNHEEICFSNSGRFYNWKENCVNVPYFVNKTFEICD